MKTILSTLLLGGAAAAAHTNFDAPQEPLTAETVRLALVQDDDDTKKLEAAARALENELQTLFYWRRSENGF